MSEDLMATARVTATDGSELTGRAISWSSSDTSVIRVAVYGPDLQRKFAGVRAMKPGTATVTATVEGQSASVPFVVSSLPAATAFLWSSLGGMRDIGGLPGATSSYATAINDAGQVVGYSEFATTERAFLWSLAGGMTDLGLPQGAVSVRATAVNAGGVVVGWSTMPNGVTRAFTWTRGGGMQMLAPLSAGESTRANGINSKGEVAGASGQLPVVWSAAGFPQRLDLLAYSQQGEAMAINDAGEIVVNMSVTSDWDNGRVVVWSPTHTKAVISSCDDTYYFLDECRTFARAINNAGMVAGSSEGRAFTWSRAAGLFGIAGLPDGYDEDATALNDAGQVVGYSHLTRVRVRSFIRSSSGGAKGVAAATGKVAVVALGINNAGQVVGWHR